jgi:hypothetical protein
VSDVFLSYASQDRADAGEVAGALQARGWNVWWDRKITAGQSYDQVIERELDTASCVVVLWSKHSVASEWVKNEAAAAAERGVLVPALIDAVKPPLEFRRKQTPNLVGWNGDPSHEGFTNLCDGVGSVLAGVAVKPVTSRAPSVAVRDAPRARHRPRAAQPQTPRFAVGGVLLALAVVVFFILQTDIPDALGWFLFFAGAGLLLGGLYLVGTALQRTGSDRTDDR